MKIDDTLKDLFIQFLNKDEELIAQLSQIDDFVLNEATWQFSLPVLHRFLVDQTPEFSGLTYSHFRTRLFKGQLNLKLKQQGAEIVVAQNHHKVDESHYRLQIINDIKVRP
jgi:hypothetical protein